MLYGYETILNWNCFYSNYSWYTNIYNILNIDLLFILLQILIIYLITQLAFETNVLRLVLLLLLFLCTLAGLLMLFQFELFACFLIVSELLLFAFIYAYLYNLNVHIKLQQNEFFNMNILYIIGFITSLGIYFFWNFHSLIIQNINDIYVIFNKLLQIYSNITFSDLIFLFNMFFIYNSLLYILLIIILFIMTFIIIYVTFLMYNLNINTEKIQFITYLQELDSSNFNSTLLLKKKKKTKKLRIMRLK